MQKKCDPGRRKGSPNYPPEFKQQLVAASQNPGYPSQNPVLENGIIRTVRESMPVPARCHRAGPRAFYGPSSGYRRTGAAGPRDPGAEHTLPVPPVQTVRTLGVELKSFTAVGLGGCMLPATVTAGRSASGLCAD